MAGVRLARDGDVLAEGTGLGGMWMGAVVLAAATSLPELLTGLNAVLQGDFPVVQGAVLAMVVTVILVNLFTDLACTVLDPRISEA